MLTLRSTPLVSVLVRCYQAGPTLRRCLASLSTQTFRDFEAVLIDDGSSDETRALLATVCDPRVRCVRLPVNLGRAAALKVGIGLARGDLIAILDADDWWYPSKLAEQVAASRRLPNAALVSANLALLDARGELHAVEGVPRRRGELVRFGPMLWPGRRRLPHPSSMFKSAALRRAPLDIGLLRCSDLQIAQSLMLRYESAVLTAPLYAYAYPRDAAIYQQCAAASRVVYSKFAREYPVSSRLMQAVSSTKQFAYRAIDIAGTFDSVLRIRGRAPTPKEAEDFEAAKRAVERAMAGMP